MRPYAKPTTTRICLQPPPLRRHAGGCTTDASDPTLCHLRRPAVLARSPVVGAGRRARPVLLGARDRLLWTRDRRLAARAALPRRGEHRAHPSRPPAASRPGRLRWAPTTAGSRQRLGVTAPAFTLTLSGLRIARRRGGYREAGSQALSESCSSKLKNAAPGCTSSKQAVRRLRRHQRADLQPFHLRRGLRTQSGLVHFGERYYGTRTGRFIQ